MKRVALTRLVLLGLAAATVGLITGVAGWYLFDNHKTTEFVKVSIGGAAVAVLFLSVSVAITLRYFFILPLCFAAGSLVCFVVAFLASPARRGAE